MSGSLNLPKFTGEPPFHQTYWLSGSPPGWFRQDSACQSSPSAVLMSAACSTVRSVTFMPAFCACSWMNWADLTVDGSGVATAVNSRSCPVSSLYLATYSLALSRLYSGNPASSR